MPAEEIPKFVKIVQLFTQADIIICNLILNTITLNTNGKYFLLCAYYHLHHANELNYICDLGSHDTSQPPAW